MRYVSTALYLLVGMAFLALGTRYVLSPELMPYHLEIIEVSWSDLQPAYQQLFLGLLKGFGIGAIGAGLSVILLAFLSFGSGRRWPLFLLSAVYSAGLLYVTSFALLTGATPIYVSMLLIGLSLAAGLVDGLRARRADS